MAKLTIDGVPQAAPEEVEFILGGGNGQLSKFPLKDLPKEKYPFAVEEGSLNFWQNTALHMEHEGTQIFNGDVEFKGAVKGLPTGGANSFIQTKQIIDMVELVDASGGKVFKPNLSICEMVLATEMDGTPVVRYNLSCTGTVNFPETPTNVKTCKVKLSGILDNGTYAFFDSVDVLGSSMSGDVPKFYTYRPDLFERRTDGFRFYVQGVKTAFSARVQVTVSFVLPNEDVGMGVPFPEIVNK